MSNQKTKPTSLLPCPFCGYRAKTYCETVTCSNPDCKMHFATVPDMHTPEEWNQREGCDTCEAYQLANEQLQSDVKRLVVEHNRLKELVAKWRDMPAEEMRLRAGEMTAQEIRSVQAVLNAILSR